MKNDAWTKYAFGGTVANLQFSIAHKTGIFVSSVLLCSASVPRTHRWNADSSAVERETLVGCSHQQRQTETFHRPCTNHGHSKYSLKPYTKCSTFEMRSEKKNHNNSKLNFNFPPLRCSWKTTYWANVSDHETRLMDLWASCVVIWNVRTAHWMHQDIVRQPFNA